MNGLSELYRQKGEAQTQIEIWSGKLQTINQKIAQEISKGDKPIQIKEAEEEKEKNG